MSVYGMYDAIIDPPTTVNTKVNLGLEQTSNLSRVEYI